MASGESEGTLKAYKITTDSGKMVGRIIMDDGQPNPARADDSNYKETVKECHTVLDNIGIPPVIADTKCPDPTCKSLLGHRLRDLVTRCNQAEDVIAQLKAIAGQPDFHERALEILGFEDKKH